MNGQVALILVTQLMGMVIKKEQGQLLQTHQLMVEKLAFLLMEVKRDLAVMSVQVSDYEIFGIG